MNDMFIIYNISKGKNLKGPEYFMQKPVSKHSPLFVCLLNIHAVEAKDANNFNIC